MSDESLEAMSKEELIRELRALRAGHRGSEEGGAEPERLIRELTAQQIELETQNRRLREAQADIEESRRRYADLYDFAPVGYCTLDSAGRLQEVNLTCAFLLGTVREQLIGRSLAELPSVASTGAVVDHLRRCAGGQARVTTELSLRQRKGGHRVVQMVSVPHRDGGGRPLVYRTVLSDITATKALERRLAFLAEAGEALGASLDYATTAAAVARLAVPFLGELCMLDVLGEDGLLRRVEVSCDDPRVQLAFAADLRRLQPRPGSGSWQSEVMTSGEPVLVNELPESMKAGCDAEELALLRAAGVRSLMVVPLAARGRPLGVLTLAATPASRPYSTDDLRFAAEVGHRAALALDSARLYEQAQAAVRARDSLLALVSHDLRTPLSVVTLKTTTLLRAQAGEPDSPSRKGLIAIRRAAERMRRLISDLLDASSLETGHMAISRADHLVSALIGDVLEAMGELAAQKSVRLETETPEVDHLSVLCDRERIQQVLTNLVENAIKFSPAGAAIRVRAEPRDGEVLFSVSDTGSGIAEEHLPYIFDRFWQAPEAVRLGSGLGLSIAKGLVEAHSGRIWAHSRVDAGSTFFFTLPLARLPGVLEAGSRPPPARAQPSSAPPADAASRPLVLIVDDDPDAREALGEALENEGYSIATAANGADALDYLRAAPPPLAVLLDLTMPVMDGWAFLDERNRDPALRAIPVIVLSGQREIDERVAAASAGYMAKPVRTEKLLRLIDQLSARE